MGAVTQQGYGDGDLGRLGPDGDGELLGGRAVGQGNDLLTDGVLVEAPNLDILQGDFGGGAVGPGGGNDDACQVQVLALLNGGAVVAGKL